MRRLLLLASVLGALLGAQPTLATVDPAALIMLSCRDGGARAQFQYNDFSPQWHLTANEGLQVGAKGIGKTHTFDGPSSSDVMSLKLPAGTGPVTISAQTVVFAAGGRIKAEASRTITCRRPDSSHYDPSAWAQGPCEDPMYRFWFDNRHSNRAVTFRAHYLDFDLGWRDVTRTVAARGFVHTGYHHVSGFSRITIFGHGRLLYSAVSAAPGNYRACW